MRFRAFLPLALLALACASGGDNGSSEAAASAAAGPRPSIHMRVVGTVQIDRTNNGPMTVAVDVTNNATETITVRRIRVQTWAMEQWAIDPVEKYVVEKLAAGQTKSIQLNATAYRISSARFISEPLQLRAFVEYEQGGRRYREVKIENGVGEQ